jgi:hypothetical protein
LACRRQVRVALDAFSSRRVAEWGGDTFNVRMGCSAILATGAAALVLTLPACSGPSTGHALRAGGRCGAGAVIDPPPEAVARPVRSWIVPGSLNVINGTLRPSSRLVELHTAYLALIDAPRVPAKLDADAWLARSEVVRGHPAAPRPMHFRVRNDLRLGRYVVVGVVQGRSKCPDGSVAGFTEIDPQGTVRVIRSPDD